MYATADYSNLYPEQRVYDSEWTESVPNGVPWYNLLTSQTIPEETDTFCGPCTAVRSHTPSEYSSSSVESCYVVLEIQRQRSIEEIPSKVENEKGSDEEVKQGVELEKKDEEDDEQDSDSEEEKQGTESEEEDDQDSESKEENEHDAESEEEMEEEIEELHFAKTVPYDNQNIDYEQVALPMTIQVPLTDRVEIKYQNYYPVENVAEVTQPVVQETPSDILFQQAKKMSKFTKRVKAISYATMKEQTHTGSSDDELSNTTKLKTIIRVNEFYPAVVSTVEAEKQVSIANSDSLRCSTTSIDSIENQSLTPSSNRPRVTTFSNLSSQRISNRTQIERLAPTVGTTSLTRTFAFDRACMEKYNRTQIQNKESMNNKLTTTDKNNVTHETKPLQKQNIQNERNLHSETTVHCHSFVNSVPTSSFIDTESVTVEESESEIHRSKYSVSSTSPNSHSKPPSSILCLMKKCARSIKTEYRLGHIKATDSSPSEPTLLEVKYLDGRLPLKDEATRESFRKAPRLSSSIASRLNRLGLSNKGSTQNLHSAAASFYSSYRKRVVNGLRTFVENNLAEPPVPTSPSSSASVPLSRSWQHKSIIELFQERKYRVNRQ